MADEQVARIELRLDVTYNLNDESKEDMIRHLQAMIASAIGRSRLTGDTSAEVDSWKAIVLEKRNVDADAELSDHDRAEVERCRREVAEEAYAKLKKVVENGPLRSKEGAEANDYILRDGTSVWIEVDNISVYVRRTEDGVAVELFPLKGESQHQLDSCKASFEAAAVWICPQCPGGCCDFYSGNRRNSGVIRR